MQCNPRYGCVTTTYGFDKCVSEWKNGQLVSCTLSGGQCAEQQERIWDCGAARPRFWFVGSVPLEGL